MTGTLDVAQDTGATLASVFAPRQKMTVWEWAEKHIVLPVGTTPRPGPYDTSWCPYVREPMERYTDPTCRKITVCFATRSAKTEMFMMMLRYSIANERQPCMWGKPNQEDANRDSELRFQPTVESSEVLRALKPLNPHLYRKAMMKFRTAPVFFVGMGSHAAVKNKQIGRMFLDEIDETKSATERQTSALQNAFERVKDTPDPKICLSSTPTIASAQIWKQFILGDQRFYFVPCWWCERPFKFVLSGIQWSPDAKQADGSWNLALVKQSVHYVCPHCKKQLLDVHKLPMLKAGHWQPSLGADRLKWELKDVPREEGHYSYHLNSIYPEWISFYTFAEKFILSKHDPEAWQSFINQWLAEPYFNFGNADEMAEALNKTVVEVTQNAPRIPPGYHPILHVDVQQLECWFRVRAFNANREAIGLDFGVAASLADCEQIRRNWGCTFAGIDIGYHDRLQEVLEFIHNHRPHWLATHGSGTMFAPIRLMQVHIGGGMLKGVPVPCIKCNPLVWKEILTNRIKGQPPRWVNEPTVSDIYKKQMTGEVRREKRGPRGTISVEYIKIGQNHAWDCEYNLLAMFDVLRPVLCGISEPPPNANAPPEMTAAPADPADKESGEHDPDQVWEHGRDQVWQ